MITKRQFAQGVLIRYDDNRQDFTITPTGLYTYRRATACDVIAVEAWHGKPLGWILIRPGGELADWPMLETELEAKTSVREFNSIDDEDDRSEAKWQARMAGDMEV